MLTIYRDIYEPNRIRRQSCRSRGCGCRTCEIQQIQKELLPRPCWAICIAIQKRRLRIRL